MFHNIKYNSEWLKSTSRSLFNRKCNHWQIVWYMRNKNIFWHNVTAWLFPACSVFYSLHMYSIFFLHPSPAFSSKCHCALQVYYMNKRLFFLLPWPSGIFEAVCLHPVMSLNFFCLIFPSLEQRLPSSPCFALLYQLPQGCTIVAPLHIHFSRWKPHIKFACHQSLHWALSQIPHWVIHLCACSGHTSQRKQARENIKEVTYISKFVGYVTLACSNKLLAWL